jgi:probable selenium-dependent hydroxylase accessory protein YqeC
MTLTEELGLSARELVAFVGAGGKSTLVLRLGEELTAAGARVALTTTTKMGTDQIPGWATLVSSPDSFWEGTAFLVGAIQEDKVIGVAPEMVDRLIEKDIDYVLVEADGARRRNIKAPDEHEPVIPSRTTTVVVVAGLEAIGGRIDEVAHRPELVAAMVKKRPADHLTTEDVVQVLASPNGGLARVPDGSRVVIALTSHGPLRDGVNPMRRALERETRIERVVVVDLDL